VCRLSRELPRLGNLQEFARLLVPPRTDGVQAANSRD
jgi:hypothetical protein